MYSTFGFITLGKSGMFCWFFGPWSFGRFLFWVGGIKPSVFVVACAVQQNGKGCGKQQTSSRESKNLLVCFDGIGGVCFVVSFASHRYGMMIVSFSLYVGNIAFLLRALSLLLPILGKRRSGCFGVKLCVLLLYARSFSVLSLQSIFSQSFSFSVFWPSQWTFISAHVKQ